MSSSKNAAKNTLLVLGAIVAALALSVLADRLVGLVAPDPVLPGTMELLFPPKSEQAFESVDFRYTAHINALGLREREISPKKAGGCRIIAIGDSYTYGWGVEAGDTWLRQVEQNLEEAGLDVETINLGKPGSGPPDYADLAERVIPLFRPDLVIVAMLQGNDLAASGPEGLEEATETLLDKVRILYPNLVRWIQERNQPEDPALKTQRSRPPQKTSAEDNRRWAANTAKEFLEKMTPEHRARFDAFDDEVKDAFLKGLLNPYMIDLAMQNARFYNFTLNLDDPWTKTCIERMAGQIRRIKRVAKIYNARLIVVSIPDGPYVNAHAYRAIQRVGYDVPDDILTSDGPDTAIRMACEMAEAPFYQVTQAFKDRRDDPDLYFALDGHLTAKGHKLYADQFAPILTEVIGGAAANR